MDLYTTAMPPSISMVSGSWSSRKGWHMCGRIPCRAIARLIHRNQLKIHRTIFLFEHHSWVLSCRRKCIWVVEALQQRLVENCITVFSFPFSPVTLIFSLCSLLCHSYGLEIYLLRLSLSFSLGITLVGSLLVNIPFVPNTKTSSPLYLPAFDVSSFSASMA